MSYDRVIPRDLFNEAKLLKCLGQLSLLIHDGLSIDPTWALVLTHNAEHSPGFRIVQDSSDGSIYCSNLVLTARGQVIRLYSPLNSKRPYPLQFFGHRRDGSAYPTVDGDVFDDDGTLSSEFRSFLEAT
jgi:hypothetical protein